MVSLTGHHLVLVRGNGGYPGRAYRDFTPAADQNATSFDDFTFNLEQQLPVCVFLYIREHIAVYTGPMMIGPGVRCEGNTYGDEREEKIRYRGICIRRGTGHVPNRWDGVLKTRRGDCKRSFGARLERLKARRMRDS